MLFYYRGGYGHSGLTEELIKKLPPERILTENRRADRAGMGQWRLRISRPGKKYCEANIPDQEN